MASSNLASLTDALVLTAAGMRCAIAALELGDETAAIAELSRTNDALRQQVYEMRSDA